MSWPPTYLLLIAFAIACSATGCSDDQSLPTDAREPQVTLSSPAAIRNNVILITVDTLRADALGAYGQDRPTSPNLDRMAREGVLFKQAMTSAPSTLPAHASIMTGNHPYVHGARSNAGFVLAQDNQTFAEIMRQAGYKTGAEIAATVIHHGTQLDQGFDQYRDISSGDIIKKKISVLRTDGSRLTRQLDERQADDITDHGIDFITTNRNDPFLLWLHYFDPHAHYIAPAEFNKLIPDSPYHAEVRYVDHEVGRLIRALELLNLGDRTLVVITADHGESLNEHDEDTHASYVYETTMHVPLIVWGTSALRKGLSIGSLVRTIDIGPTILDLLGLPPLNNTQGRSLAALLRGETSDLHLMAYGESLELQSLFGSSILRGVRHEKWKYIHKLLPELYDLTLDPGELHNVAAANPAVVESLFDRMRNEILNAPKKTATGVVALDDETFRQLQALGYAGAVPQDEMQDELSTLVSRGPDPSSLTDDLHRYSEAWGHSSNSDYTRAAKSFRRLADLHPDSLTILMSLADALIHLEKYDDAVSVLHRAIDVASDHEKAYRLLAESQEALGRFKEAEAAIRRSIDLQPCGSGALLRLAQILGKNNRPLEQAAVLRQGIEACSVGYEVLNNYASLLATSQNIEIRDPIAALHIAKLAVEKSQGNRPEILDTLASAYLAAGDWENAIQISEGALAMAKKRAMPQPTIEALESKLRRFRQAKQMD